MSAGARLFLFWIGAAAIIGVGLLIWGWRRGQFRNIEEAKYRMLEDREPEPWGDGDSAASREVREEDEER